MKRVYQFDCIGSPIHYKTLGIPVLHVLFGHSLSETDCGERLCRVSTTAVNLLVIKLSKAVILFLVIALC